MIHKKGKYSSKRPFARPVDEVKSATVTVRSVQNSKKAKKKRRETFDVNDIQTG